MADRATGYRPKSPERIIPLEGLRGLAAIIVFLCHWMLGFNPELMGVAPVFSMDQSINGQLWTFLVNGRGAVVFFFVLSGFVLSRAAFIKSRTEQNGAEQIAKAVIKRWPRLALPTLIATMTSWSLAHLNLYYYRQAGAITQSSWLTNFGSDYPHDPTGHSLWSAFTQGAYLTFIRGNCNYDTAIWTMHFEFIASFVIFGFCLLLPLYRNASPWLVIAPLTIAMLLLNEASVWYPPFLVGLLAAYILPEKLKLNTVYRWVVAAISLYLLGCQEKIGVYTIFEKINYQYVDSVGAFLLISVCYDINLSPGVSRMAKFLGALSFPFYLLHLLVICSFGAWSYLWLERHHIHAPSSLAGILAFLITVLVSLPFIAVNQRWTRWINIKISALFTRASPL